MTTDHILHVRHIADQVPYETTWLAMKTFTDQRGDNTPDELWLLEHPSVFTQGQNGKPEHILKPGDIPIVQTDRGGQVTYHGPGQLMMYTLIDLKRKKLQVRTLVSQLEDTIIDFLKAKQIAAYSKKEAPGIYLTTKTALEEQKEAKICSIGLRIRRGCSYHGLAFNIAMDLEPFTRINPCGFNQLSMSQVSDFIPGITVAKAAVDVIEHLKMRLFYTTIHTFNQLPG